jgi:hypothetical protein
MPARTLMAINCQSLFPPHLTIIMVFSGWSAICRSNGIFRDRTMPAELVDLNRILLTLARSRGFPDGSSRHGYDFIAPLDPEGHIDPILWKKYRDYCRVRRFWAGEDDEVGRLVHKPGGAEHARWVFEYDPGRDDDDEVGYKLGEHAFLPGDYVSISGKDGKLQTFRIISVNPVLIAVNDRLRCRSRVPDGSPLEPPIRCG